LSKTAGCAVAAEPARSMKRKISVIFGTRPEAIKLAPVILALQSDRAFDCEVCVTAQHREMLDQVLNVFDIVPHTDLSLMTPGQTLTDLTCRALKGLDGYLAEQKPDLVLVQGDTTTVFAAALACFYGGIPVGHVEAGLRTGNLRSPWPEEGNRVLTTDLAALHFVPTEVSRNNLLAEGVRPEKIFITGNTVIDALFLATAKLKQDPDAVSGWLPPTGAKRRLVLITGHRRESFGGKLESICLAVRELAERFPDVDWVYPVHLNPTVRATVARILGSADGPAGRAPNIHLVAPLPYLPFVALMEKSTLILTDSGGIQEEAPSLGKPVLVTRETTERPEAIDGGTAKLVGADRQRIVQEATRLLSDQDYYEAMSQRHNPYGDGKASQRILGAIRDYFQM
jgi:UDP-N-acetylglucosamine 2-epimerase (non-hydrolysing)